MIWLIGGTKDSRDFLESITKKRRDIVVTTTTAYGAKLLEDCPVRVEVGALDLAAMRAFVEREGITKIVDMSHPYAIEVSKQAMEVAKDFGLAYYRFEREIIERLAKKHSLFSSLEELLDYLSQKEGKILVTLGSNLLPAFRDFPKKKDCYFRILPKSDMIARAEEVGILAKQILALQGPFSKRMNLAMLEEYEISYMITKRSGNTGGEAEKLAAADEMGVELCYLDRPKLDYPKVFSDWKDLEKEV